MKRYLILLLPAAALFLLPACEKKIENQVVLARVDNSQFTLRDLEEQIPLAFQDMISSEQKVEYVKNWIDDELLYHEALAAQLDKDKDIVDAIDRLKRDFLIQKLVEARLERNVTITEAEIKNYYNANLSQFILEDEMVRASQIVVKDAKTAWQLLREIKKEDNFGITAKKHSMHPSADLEGDMGYFNKWDLEPRLSQVCFSQPESTVSNPVKSDDGYHLFMITDKRAKGDPKPLVLVRENIINLLDKLKKQESLSRLIQDLRKKYTVTMQTDALNDESGRHRFEEVPENEDMPAEEPSLGE